jgi:uncharacterized protein (TIGR00369 family)
MRKIHNPFVNSEHHNFECFGCSPKNDVGLKLEFWDAGDEIISTWKPKKYLEGYANVVHGGIQATLMDEVASWAVYTKCETAGVTSNLNIRYKNPLMINGDEITIRAKVQSLEKRLVHIETCIEDKTGKVYAEGIVTYFVYPKEIAVKKLHYPGVDAFYETTL